MNQTSVLIFLALAIIIPIAAGVVMSGAWRAFFPGKPPKKPFGDRSQAKSQLPRLVSRDRLHCASLRPGDPVIVDAFTIHGSLEHVNDFGIDTVLMHGMTGKILDGPNAEGVVEVELDDGDVIEADACLFRHVKRA